MLGLRLLVGCAGTKGNAEKQVIKSDIYAGSFLADTVRCSFGNYGTLVTS